MSNGSLVLKLLRNPYEQYFIQIYKIDDLNCALNEAYENSPIPITQDECTCHSYETISSSPNHDEGSAEVGFVCFSYTKSNTENYKKCLM